VKEGKRRKLKEGRPEGGREGRREGREEPEEGTTGTVRYTVHTVRQVR
jgi:hypothetical protein